MKLLPVVFFIFGVFLQKARSNPQYQSFGGSYSTINSNNGGNNVIISRRMGPNQNQEDYISVSVPAIRIDGDDYFSCSTLICPKNAFKCVVTSEAVLEDETQMKTVAECLDLDDNLLEKKEYLEKNPMPNMKPPFSRHSAVDREGSISIEDSAGHNVFNSKKMTKEQEQELANQMERMHQQQQQMQQQFQAQMQKFSQDMQNTFGNGFPFGKNGFQFGNQVPFSNNFPFYYPTVPFPNFSPFYYQPYPPQPQTPSVPEPYQRFSSDAPSHTSYTEHSEAPYSSRAQSYSPFPRHERYRYDY